MAGPSDTLRSPWPPLAIHPLMPPNIGTNQFLFWCFLEMVLEGWLCEKFSKIGKSEFKKNLSEKRDKHSLTFTIHLPLTMALVLEAMPWPMA
jgi:hypothetical protein